MTRRRSRLWPVIWPGLALGLLLLPTAAAWLDGARSVTGRRFSYARAPYRVVVLGFDGVDPAITTEYMDRLPNTARLARDGTFLPCRTTNPPESPVAWATFATGMNPGGHGIFDFVRRDTGARDSYRPLNAMVDARPPRFGPFDLPLGPPKARNLRSGEAFWETVSSGGFHVSALRVPVSFPARPMRGGEVLAGLGVPDLRATIGSYTLFAAGRDAWEGHTEFGGRHLKIYPRGGLAESVLEGPLDPRSPESGRRLTVPVRFSFAGDAGTVTVGDGPAVPVDRNTFSRWVSVRFAAGPFVRLRGFLRFLLLRSGKDPAVYASPIQIAPVSPPVPLSAPDAFAATVADRLGQMKTQGWPEDTFAANDGVLDDVQLFHDIRGTYHAHESLCLDRLDNTDAALVVAVFTATDRVQHMYFRYRDPRHPARDARRMADFQARTGIADPILESYRWMDATIGLVRERLAPEDILIVVSDHGFQSWRFGVNLNTWLLREGYLQLADPTATKRIRKLDEFFRRSAETAHIDWPHTRAYALGLGAIYMNLRGREHDGAVDPAEAEALAEEIRGKLVGLVGPDGKAAFTEIYRGDRIWRGARMGEAPDLQCAFAPGYRVSWQTALLGVPEETFEVNTYAWSGDHCSNDPAQVPAIFLSNLRLPPDADPALEDIAATVCDLFGVAPPPSAEGKVLPLSRP